MKQIIPFIIIAIIVGGALFILQDDYVNNTYDPIAEAETESLFWQATFFLQAGEEEGEYDLGVVIKPTDDEWEIEAIEFFFYSPFGSLTYQELDIEDFSGEIIYTEPCSYCSFGGEGAENPIDDYADLTINWKIDGYTRNDHLYAPLNFNDILTAR